jgi:hypothetical protein
MVARAARFALIVQFADGHSAIKAQGLQAEQMSVLGLLQLRILPYLMALVAGVPRTAAI